MPVEQDSSTTPAAMRLLQCADFKEPLIEHAWVAACTHNFPNIDLASVELVHPRGRALGDGTAGFRLVEATVVWL